MSALTDSTGFRLTTLVEAQRGLSDFEAYQYLITGEMPDLTQLPDDPQNLRGEPDTQVMSLSDARSWLAGNVPLVASSFLGLSKSHSESLNGETSAFKFNPKQPRGSDGKWVEFPGGDVAKLNVEPLWGKSALNAPPKRFHIDKLSDIWEYDSPAAKINTDDELDGLTEYTGNGHRKINSELRQHSGNVALTSTSTQRLIGGLDSLLTDSELPSGITTFRGIKDGRAVFGDAWDSNLTGAQWTEHGYFSTSPRIAVAKGFSFPPNATNALMEINVPAGVRALTLSEWDDEAEILTQRGLTLTITKDHGVVDGQRKLSVKVVQSGTSTKAKSADKDVQAAQDGTSSPGFGEIDDGLPGTSDQSVVTGLVTTGKLAVPATIYKKHADGAVVAETGDSRMRWDASAKKFVVEKRAGADWQETSQLTKSAAYNELKTPDRWFEPGAEPMPTPTPTPEPTAQDIGQTGTDVETVAPPQTPDVTPADSQPTAEIGAYAGPTLDDYAGAPKEITDKLRAAYLEQFHHEQRIEKRADAISEQLKAENPGKYFFWSQALDQAREELSTEAPTGLDEALEALFAAVPGDYNVRDTARRRLHLEAVISGRLDEFTQKNGLGKLTPEVQDDLTQRVRQAFAGKKIAVRASPKTIEHILASGRIKSQFETNKSSGKKDVDIRANIERLLFANHDKPWTNAETRPIYGYVALDGVRPAGIGSAELGNPSTDALSQYGQVQIILKDSVRDRTTAMFGDSMNNMEQAIPTPVNNPDWRSFQSSNGGITGKGLEGLDRSGDSQAFRAGAYAEAQIHGGVSVDDIEEIVFPTNPTAALKTQLDNAGVPWRVLNFKTVTASGTNAERATALRIAREDKVFIEGEIAELREKLADAKWAGNDYYKRDIAKYEKQLKAINDALPKLEAAATT